MVIKKFQRSLTDLSLFGILVTLVVIISLTYTSLEHTFYFWDFAMFQRDTVAQVDRSTLSYRLPIRVALNSLGDDYNKLYTLPLIPLLRLYGAYQSRSIYILSIALVYFLPYLLLIGMTGKLLIPHRPRAVFWLSILIALLVPAVWLPTLRGYPDAGGAFLLGLAVWAYLYDMEVRRWWQFPLIGISLAAAPLFRRHFLYGVTGPGF